MPRAWFVSCSVASSWPTSRPRSAEARENVLVSDIPGDEDARSVRGARLAPRGCNPGSSTEPSEGAACGHGRVAQPSWLVRRSAYRLLGLGRHSATEG